MAGKRLKEEGEDTTENYVFNCVCLLSERLLGKVREAAKIYGTMYQLAETCYTALFVKTEILDEHRRLFSAIRSATEDPNIPSYLEFFLKLNQISKVFLLT